MIVVVCRALTCFCCAQGRGGHRTVPSPAAGDVLHDGRLRDRPGALLQQPAPGCQPRECGMRDAIGFVEALVVVAVVAVVVVTVSHRRHHHCRLRLCCLRHFYCHHCCHRYYRRSRHPDLERLPSCLANRARLVSSHIISSRLVRTIDTPCTPEISRNMLILAGGVFSIGTYNPPHESDSWRERNLPAGAIGIHTPTSTPSDFHITSYPLPPVTIYTRWVHKLART